MQPGYITEELLTARVSRATLLKILDDDDDGEIDAIAMEGIIRDATSIVNAYLRGLVTLPFEGEIPDYVVTITLDIAQGMLGQRRPEVVQYDWRSLLEDARTYLKDLRKSDTRLDVVGGAQDPPKNVGGGVRGGFSKGTTVRKPRFLDNMGDY